jgi:hypothetical protein
MRVGSQLLVSRDVLGTPFEEKRKAHVDDFGEQRRVQ